VDAEAVTGDGELGDIDALFIGPLGGTCGKRACRQCENCKDCNVSLQGFHGISILSGERSGV